MRASRKGVLRKAGQYRPGGGRIQKGETGHYVTRRTAHLGGWWQRKHYDITVTSHGDVDDKYMAQRLNRALQKLPRSKEGRRPWLFPGRGTPAEIDYTTTVVTEAEAWAVKAATTTVTVERVSPEQDDDFEADIDETLKPRVKKPKKKRKPKLTRFWGVGKMPSVKGLPGTIKNMIKDVINCINYDIK